MKRRYSVTVKPRSKIESVEIGSDGTLTVRVSAPPVDGKANEQVVELIAEYFKVPRRDVSIVSGISSRKKIVEVL